MLWSGNFGLKMGVLKMEHTQYPHNSWKWARGTSISSYASLAKKLPRETNWNSILSSEYIIYSGAIPISI